MKFTWFDIDTDPDGWSRLSNGEGDLLFSREEVLSVHRFGDRRLCGIVADNDKRVIIGGMRTADGKLFETLGFPGLDSTSSPGLLNELLSWIRRQGVTEIRLGSYNGGVDGYSRDFSAEAVQRLEFVWDLRPTEQDRMSGIRSNHKRKLKKALNRGFRLQEISSRQALLLTRLRWIWEQRKGGQSGLRKIIGSWLYHRRLIRGLGGSGVGKLYGYYGPDGEILSVAYMLEYADTAFYMLGASSSAGYQQGASVAMFWDMSKMYANRGFSFLNLGGVPIEASSEGHEEYGVYRFKRGYGIEPVVRTSLKSELEGDIQ